MDDDHLPNQKRINKQNNMEVHGKIRVELITSPLKMNFVSGLKTEWALLWESFLGDDEKESRNNDFESEENDDSRLSISEKLEVLSLEQIRALIKVLSSDRKEINQRLEAVQKEIEQETRRLENIELLGGEPEETIESLGELNDLGQSLSDRLLKLDEKLKIIRSREDRLRAGLKQTK